MSDGFNTDGMYGMPVTDTNCLASIEMAIAFDVRDWSEDRRSAWIYGIVFGWDESEEYVKTRYGWSDTDIERMKKYHSEWENLKKMIAERKEGEEEDDKNRI